MTWRARYRRRCVINLAERADRRERVTRDRADLEAHGQVQQAAEGVYRQTGLLGGTLMYAVRKAALASLIRHDYRGHFDNAIVANTYVLLPDAEGVANASSRNFHFGVCYQGDDTSDVRP